MNTTKYFIYARKSTDREDKQIASIDDQVSEMKKIASRKGYKIADIIFESRSAKEPGRPKFKELIRRIKKKEARGILVWKLNRLARNQIDGGLVSHELQNGTIEHIVTHSGEFLPSSNVLLMALEFGIANQYIKDLSTDTRRGLRSKAYRGWYPNSLLPIGYQHVEISQRKNHNDKEIIIHPDSYHLVKNLWDKMLTGNYTLTDIFEYSRSCGLVNRKGVAFSKNTIANIFDKSFYYGVYKWKDEDGEYQLIKGKHQPMVSYAQFQRVQEIIRPKLVKRTHRNDIPLKGIILCGNCNSSVCGDRKIQIICPECRVKFSVKRKDACPQCQKKVSSMKNPSGVDKTYYRCTRRRNSCLEKAVTQHDLENQIDLFLANLTIPQEFYELIYQWIQDDFPEKIENDNALEQSYREQLKKLKSKSKRLLIMRADNELSAEEYQELKSDINTKVSELEHEILLVEERNKIDTSTLADYTLFLQLMKSRLQNASLVDKKMMLQKLCSNLILQGKSLYFAKVSTVYNLQEAFNVYSAYFSELEPKNRHIKYSDFKDLSDLKIRVLGSLRVSRTQDSQK